MNEKTRERINVYAPLCGVVGPGIIALGMLLSAVTYSGTQGQPYSPLNHFVSELGEVGVAELSVTFNWGLIIGGLVTIPFMAYLAAQIKSWIRWPLGLIGILTALFAVLVGIYPMNYIDPHTVAALTFFQLGVLTSMLYSLVILFSKRHPFPKWLAIPGLLYVVTFVWFSFFPDLIPMDIDFRGGMEGFAANRPDVLPLTVIEWIMVLAILLWILLMGIFLTAHREQSTNGQ
jgi:hypothetical membrane protein